MSDKEKDEVLEEAEKDTADQGTPEGRKSAVGSDGGKSGDDLEKEAGTEGGAEEKEPDKEEEDMKTQYLRLAADFQNYKRRSEKEKSDIYAFANEKIVSELLDVIDNFERAMLHRGECGDNGLAEGMNMIFKQLKGVLEKNKVEEIKAEGEEFDPNFHHAVMTENSVEFESGRVTQVLQKGYSLNGKIIRPAMVKVAE